jgi:hypothetical protein
VRWTIAEGRTAVRAWERSGLTLGEFERRHEIGVGKLSWWKRRIESGGEADAVTLAPMVATGSSSAVIVRIAEVEIEVRADLVPAEWLSRLVAELVATTRTRA